MLLWSRETKSVPDAVKITNVVMTGAVEGLNLFIERQYRIEDETEIFVRQPGHNEMSLMEIMRG